MGLQPLLGLVFLALNILSFLILVDVVLSWATMLGGRGVSPNHPWVRALHRVTTPVLEPFRKLLPPSKLQGWDLSPFLAILAIQFVQDLLRRAALGL